MKLITDIQITPIIPCNGLVAFASFIYNQAIFVSSIAIHAKLDGSGYRLTYPTKRAGNSTKVLFHPITKELSKAIEEAVIAAFLQYQNH